MKDIEPSPEPTEASSSPRAIAAGDQTAVSDCDSEQAASQEWKKRNAVIIGYIRSLGALANADQVPSFDKLGSALVANGVLKQAQDDAFSKLIKSIALSETHAGQEDAIGRAVKAADGPLKEAMHALKLVDNAYARQLDAEYEALVSVYGTQICDELLAVVHEPGNGLNDQGRCRLRADYPEAIPAAVRLKVQGLSTTLDSVVGEIVTRWQATNGYAHALDVIQSTHDDLVASAQGKLTPSTAVSIIKKHLVEIISATSDVQKAVK